MDTQSKHSLKKSFITRPDKFRQKREQLKEFINQSDYLDSIEQHRICRNFGLPYMPKVFQDEYRQRFFDYLKENTTTVATVSKTTNIPHKFLTHCKAYYEKRGLLQVVAIGICETAGSHGVQFVSTNPETWGNFKLPYDNQLDLFDDNSKILV